MHNHDPNREEFVIDLQEVVANDDKFNTRTMASVTRHRSYAVLGVELDSDCGPQSVLTQTPCMQHKTPKISLYKYDEVPHYLQGNPYIKKGYRAHLSASHCFSSLLLWSNESVNIWSHLIGFVIFFCVMLYENLTVVFAASNMSSADHIYVTLGLACYQVCMLLSSFYHLLYCHSETANRRWLSLDLAGVCIGLIGCYLPAVHLAFYCHQVWRDFYMLVVFCMAVLTLSLQFHPRFLSESWNTYRLVLYSCVAGYGVIPACHWIYLNGGFDAEIVRLFFGKVIVIYLLGITALVFYAAKIPERFVPGKVDYIGASHQWWHVIVVISFIYWHQAGKVILQYRIDKPCIY